MDKDSRAATVEPDNNPRRGESHERFLEHKHGWFVPLTCTRCGHAGIPHYNDWTPSISVRFGNSPSIYAQLFCTQCGKGLQEEAGQELVRFFADHPMDETNKRMIWKMLLVLGAIPLLGAAIIWLGIRQGLWGAWAYSLLSLLSILIPPAIFWFNYQVAAIRHRCPCGKPDYVFMGMLGRSYCYRCSSCGRLLRLRD